MRVLFTPLAPTHYFHMVPTAWALRAAGHEVRVAVQPPVADAVTRTGLHAVALGGGFDFMAEAVATNRRIEERVGKLPSNIDSGEPLDLSPDDVAWVQRERLGVIMRTALAMGDELAAFSRWWKPDLVVTDPLVLAAPLGAEPGGGKLVRLLWGIGVPGAGVPTEFWPEEFRAMFRRNGVEPKPEYAVANVDPVPASMQIPDVADRLPVRCVPYNGPGTLPEWLREPADRPRVCLTLGSVVTQMKGESKVGADLLTGLAGLGVEVVAAVSAADRERLGAAPDGVRIVERLPLHLLLPTCSAIIHHGGASTTLTAAYHGVPQLVVDPESDDYLMAKALAGTGAGATLPAERVDADGVKTALAELLEDAAGDAAARLRDEVHAQPTPAALVSTLEALV